LALGFHSLMNSSLKTYNMPDMRTETKMSKI
jgi:hypothetical protein